MKNIVTKNKINRCSYYFALEEYLLKNAQDEEYFFIWQIDKSLVVGRNQLIYDELNLKNAQEDSINIYRRPSGGGAVYADQNCLMFSFITPNFDTKMVFNTYLNKMVSTFAKIGIECEFSGRNDLLIEGKKFSGNAFYRLNQHACLHGTLLFATDLSIMGRYLTPNKLKLGSKGISSVVSRVTNINEYYCQSKETFAQELIYNLTVDDYVLSDEEEKIISSMQIKYEDYDWIYRKTIYTKKIATYSRAGIIDFNFSIVNNIITDCKINGDYFAIKDISILEEAFLNLDFNLDNLKMTIKNNRFEEFIYDYDNDITLKMVEEAFL